ncbi:uncharacterized protein LOC110719901 [Chenopodium quinoa]|uniref:uncharacterized protein LOC110719901 n=1 Tax=Chenopodium quinoa TaxID=63459 RepID=UPI000B770D80|nr:uncharacterized protein LOC110719901 [Chenopodium quinoa]
MLIQTFYNGLTHEFQIYIDAASRGSLLTKNPTEAKELVEKMAANDNYHLGGRNSVKMGGDPGSYSNPVKLGDIEINRALCDLGVSVSLMPLSICKKLQMGEIKPTRISLQLANRSVKFPLGVLKDVPLCVGKFFIPCDFVVMEMEEDAHVPIILDHS